MWSITSPVFSESILIFLIPASEPHMLRFDTGYHSTDQSDENVFSLFPSFWNTVQ